MSGRDGEAVEALSVSPARSMSPENGLQRTSLELLPFTTAFFATQLGWPERAFLLIRKVRASVEPSVVASGSFRRYKERCCGGKCPLRVEVPGLGESGIRTYEVA